MTYEPARRIDTQVPPLALPYSRNQNVRKLLAKAERRPETRWSRIKRLVWRRA